MNIATVSKEILLSHATLAGASRSPSASSSLAASLPPEFTCPFGLNLVQKLFVSKIFTSSPWRSSSPAQVRGGGVGLKSPGLGPAFACGLRATVAPGPRGSRPAAPLFVRELVFAALMHVKPPNVTK